MTFTYTPAQAYWNQRYALSLTRDRIFKLIEAVDYKGDLSSPQWAQLMASVLEFKPDLIIELGRHRGNSTCAFTEAANLLIEQGADIRVVSLCLSDDWDRITRPRLEKAVTDDWFRPLEILKTDILAFDYDNLLSKSSRILLFWDAHGYDIAECILGGILPKIVDRPNLIIMHDLSDTRYSASEAALYGENGLWKGGNDATGPRVRIGNIDSAVEQAVAIVDFTSRNNIPIDSADHSIHTEIGADMSKVEEMQRVLGNDLFSPYAHWFWFILNGSGKSWTFPKFNVDKKHSGNDKYSLMFEILGVSLLDDVIMQPELIRIIPRINRYLGMGKTNLALKMIEAELGNLDKISSVLSNLKPG